jgi:hypothetical protein
MNLLKKTADVQMIDLFFQISFIYYNFRILSQQLKIKLTESTFMLLIAFAVKIKFCTCAKTNEDKKS